MRIQLPLHPDQFVQKSSTTFPSDSPLISIGGELVLIELQGELAYEGEKSNGVVGVLGFDRPDKPTLHLGEHHLLHGKIATLQKPYAVIRKAVGGASEGTALEGDASEEEDEVDRTSPIASTSTSKRRRTEVSGPKVIGTGVDNEEEEEEEEGPLFAPDPDIFPTTPTKTSSGPASSSPFDPPSAARDYSSELDPGSSPARWEDDEDEEEVEKQRVEHERERMKREKAKAKRKREEKERTRHYEVVGIVRKKVVFALRPEPIVTATILPE